MKQPKLSDLKIDHDETRKIRASMKKTKKIKVTINKKFLIPSGIRLFLSRKKE